MTDDELIELLRTAGDRVTRAQADEVIARGAAIVPRLAGIVSDAEAWEAEGDAFWAPVHATYLLGAIGGAEAVGPLVEGLRAACGMEGDEWVTEELPAIFAALGPSSVEPLRDAAFDASLSTHSRHVAMESLSAVAAAHPDHRERIADILRDLAGQPGAPLEIRGWAGMVLLEFTRREDRPLLERLAQEQQRTMNFPRLFGAHCVETAYRDGGHLDPLPADWLDFYNADEIADRQRRWVEEDGEDDGGGVEHEHEHEHEHGYGDDDDGPPPGPIVNVESAPGRNDPCPCGSGRKYKKCCGK